MKICLFLLNLIVLSHANDKVLQENAPPRYISASIEKNSDFVTLDDKGKKALNSFLKPIYTEFDTLEEAQLNKSIIDAKKNLKKTSFPHNFSIDLFLDKAKRTVLLAQKILGLCNDLRDPREILKWRNPLRNALESLIFKNYPWKNDSWSGYLSSGIRKVKRGGSKETLENATQILKKFFQEDKHSWFFKENALELYLCLTPTREVQNILFGKFEENDLSIPEALQEVYHQILDANFDVRTEYRGLFKNILFKDVKAYQKQQKAILEKKRLEKERKEKAAIMLQKNIRNWIFDKKLSALLHHVQNVIREREEIQKNRGTDLESDSINDEEEDLLTLSNSDYEPVKSDLDLKGEKEKERTASIISGDQQNKDKKSEENKTDTGVTQKILQLAQENPKTTAVLGALFTGGTILGIKTFAKPGNS